MKLSGLIIVSTLILSSNAMAKDHDYICNGKDKKERAVKIIFDEYVGPEQRANANVTITVEGKAIKTYKGLEVYVDSEGGFDYGVTGSDFMFLLIMPPNMLGKGQVAGSYYYGSSYRYPKVVLECTEF
ncbi:MAG: hypothetical protein AABZ06_00320 [Bdellovibrionota bacterium]